VALGASLLVDKSALTRVHHRAVGRVLDGLAERGDIATCSIIDLEVGFSARGAKEHALLISQRQLLPQAPITQKTLDRALSVQGLLARRGEHRVSLPDLIISACAEEHGLTVLHYDRDFDTIARVTHQKSQWVVPRGSVP